MSDDQDKTSEPVDKDQIVDDQDSAEETEDKDEDTSHIDDADETYEGEKPQINESEIETPELLEGFDPETGTIQNRQIVEEMQTSYLDYAMSVIVSRALPDVRDGMKPVHRRVLYAMYQTGLRHNSRYRKSAAVVGEVLKSFHPHGDVAVYDTLVRMAQDFSMRYMLVDGQGNFGSMDGDSAAAMRYTECRMSALAEEMLLDIDKDTVDWQDNYDGSTVEPQVLPSRIPQLLLNGSMGIAVGMATNIPPHNISELCDGIAALIENPELNIEELMKHIKGPDFPTGGIIYNIEDIKTAYATGKGKIVMRAKAEIEEAKRGFRIIITEIPYQVNKSSLIEKMAELVKTKRLEGISDIRDESDRAGVRVVIELRSNAFPKKILNRLFELTPMQTAFHVNMLALTPEMEPRVMTLLDVLNFYIEHRRTVLTRRTKYELKRAKDRAHILEGLKIALDNIDAVIDTIKKSQSKETAKVNLKAKFKLSDKQADAILEMRLSSLAALERQKIENEYQEILGRIAYLEDLLAHPEKILSLISKDLAEVKEKYGDARRTEIVPHALDEFSAEDLIPNQQVIVSLTRGNYIKRQDVDTYHKQIRGGVGVVGMATKEEDIVDHLACCYSHDDIYFFTNSGRIFASKVYELPATSRQSKGTPVVNIIQISPSEKVTALLTVDTKNGSSKFFVMGTKKGTIKRTEIEKYKNIRKTGIVAIGLKLQDELKWVKQSSGRDIVVEVTELGLAICYKEEDARPMGRSAAGVMGIRVKGADQVMSMDVVPGELADFEESGSKYLGPDMLVVLENGFGKRTMLKHFHLQRRGGMGIKAANCTPKTGKLIGMHITYSDLGDVVLASQKGQFIRMTLKDIKRLGRDTQGVTLIRLKGGDKVSSVALILPEEPKKESAEANKAGPSEPKIDSKDHEREISSKSETDAQREKPSKPQEAKAKILNTKKAAQEKVLDEKAVPKAEISTPPKLQKPTETREANEASKAMEEEVKISKNIKEEKAPEEDDRVLTPKGKVSPKEINFWGRDNKFMVKRYDNSEGDEADRRKPNAPSQATLPGEFKVNTYRDLEYEEDLRKPSGDIENWGTKKKL
ncbi:DNA gyrase subunit A [Candidatus Berkelbacteria bacterium RIFOXYA2_FULL_43_10]|uniref:DNA gyrase subunit A n=1 Tax=Candidatus Berkelbacteria bacterium RIFOXYA2_FULL_43_10 TaxID=1797472 RepID=A0A1F5E3Q3_9BACT|nr:MAG: DNA gyrase subunit A [Candidatus Berkelbacteria bacterium RIFOXYA2_FULL_43_10]